MTIFVNDSEVSFETATTLQEVLSSLNIKNFEGVAVALNDEVVSKTELEKVVVKENDKILVIRAFQGG